MNTQEFIEKLKAALNGRVSSTLVAENINYYQDYIRTEIKKGRSEAEILASLGDPRLIAKTIIETNGTANAKSNTAYGNNSYYQESGYRSAASQNNNYGNNEYGKKTGKSFRIPGWAIGIIILLIVMLILGMIFSMLSFLAPIIIPVIIVMFLVKLFRDWLN